MKVVVSDRVLMQEIEDELVIMNVQDGRYYGLPAPGPAVWEKLTALGDTDLVVQALLADFDADENTVRQDVEALVTRLADAGLVTCVEDEPQAMP
jgi:hypothetical protein